MSGMCLDLIILNHFGFHKIYLIKSYGEKVLNSENVPANQYLAPDKQVIKVKSDLRDLGVQLSSNLNFKVYIKNVLAFASKLASWRLRTFFRTEVEDQY